MRAYLVVVGDIKAILLNLLDVKLDEVLSQRGVEPKAGGTEATMGTPANNFNKSSRLFCSNTLTYIPAKSDL